MTHNIRPFDVNYIVNPSQDQLRELALMHTPCTFVSAYGNLMKVSRNKARMAKYTYIIDTKENAHLYSHQVIDPDHARELIDRQTAYIHEKGTLIDLRGALGLGDRAVDVQWLYTPEAANIAGMQSLMAFPCQDNDSPQFQIIYTPDLFLNDMPGRQAIIVSQSRSSPAVLICVIIKHS